MNRAPFTLALLVLAVLGAALLSNIEESKPIKDKRATYLKGGDFSLEYNGSALSLSDLKGQPVLLYFGYTFCPDVCPVGLAVIRDTLKSDQRFADVKALFITLDPERDDAERLNSYTQFFHENIIGLTGSVDVIREISSSYGAFFRKSGNEENYTVDHSAYYYVLDAQGDLIRVLDHDASAAEISEILLSLL